MIIKLTDKIEKPPAEFHEYHELKMFRNGDILMMAGEDSPEARPYFLFGNQYYRVPFGDSRLDNYSVNGHSGERFRKIGEIDFTGTRKDFTGK